jgi:thiol-disulfide isomerase/thioredoxin
LAQAPVEGVQYIKLSQPVAPGMLPPAGKIDVSEFFWYECPHCNAFEPLLEPWARKLPADVAFRRVPVGFTALTAAYELDGVPALGIGGLFLTSPGMATRGERVPESESGRRALLVADQLLQQVPRA